MNGKLGKALAYAALIIALVVVTILGVRLPSPAAPDMDIGAQAARVADFIIPTTNPTATPGVIIDNRSGGSVSLQFRSQMTPVARINRNGGGVFAGGMDIDGASFDVDVTGAASIDADAESNFNVAGAGIDLTLESEGGRVILSGGEVANNAVTIDANTGVTSGLDINLGSVSGMSIDGGPTNIGGGSPGLASGDNDLYVTADLEVDGIAQFDGLVRPSFADETITDGETLTPTVMVYALDSGGGVTLTLAASASEGQLLILIGDDANTITVADTNIRTTDGNAVTIGQYDVVIFVFQDSEWLHVSKSANS